MCFLLFKGFDRLNPLPKGKGLAHEAFLEVRKLYRVIPDDDAAAHGYIRVIDESGEDYAYTASRFHLMQLPTAVEEALLSASQA